jgi:peptide/nickel transport system permease protein
MNRLLYFALKRAVFSLITIFGVTLIIYAFYFPHSGSNNFILGYFNWWGDIFSGNWGSVNVPIYNGSILSAIATFLPNTLMLSIFTAIFIWIIGVYSGIFSATNFSGNILNPIAYILYSSPIFVLIIFLIVIFGVALKWLPFVGSINPLLLTNVNWYSNGVSYPTHIVLIDAILHGDWTAAYDAFLHLLLPALSLILAFSAGVMIIIRATAKEIMNKNFYKFLFLRDISKRRINYNHLLKNSLIPPLTFFTYLISSFLSGEVIVEAMFTYPGIGLLLVQSLQQSQYLAILDLSFVFSLVFVIASFTLDMLYAYIDPRAEI